jgi:hypothetical protein
MEKMRDNMKLDGLFEVSIDQIDDPQNDDHADPKLGALPKLGHGSQLEMTVLRCQTLHFEISWRCA